MYRTNKGAHEIMKKLISVVIPAYNEEEVIDELSKRLKAVMDRNVKYDFEVIIIENGSVDLTFQKLIEVNKNDSRFKIIRLSRNFTSDGGSFAGLKYAKGDAVVIMNADLQDPPELIPEFIKKWESGYEIVYGIITKRKGVAITRRFASSLFYELTNRLTGGLFPKNVSNYRLIDKKVCAAINEFPERNRFLRGIIAWTGFTSIGISFERPPRFAGESKANFLDVLQYALHAVYAFSYFPLKVITVIGLTLSICSFIAIIIYIALYLIYETKVPGLTTLLTLMLFLFGMLFLILGIMGEYLSRIYDEVKQRPNFIIKEKVGL
jgi:dolichol-phosphate mannosyltransferase